jgi:predicted amidophosphoribosyltransferase
MWHFLDFLFPPREDEALLRAAATDTFLAAVSPRIVERTHPHTIALLPFSVPIVRAAIHEAKYHGSKQAFDVLSDVLVEYLCEERGLMPPVLVPMPLSAKRRRVRMFNQVEEVVARAARKLAYKIDTEALYRVKDTASQIALPRIKREENMRGAFGAAHPLDPAILYIVVDDVITTGATLQAAIDALTRAGAIHILPLALAH